MMGNIIAAVAVLAIALLLWGARMNWRSGDRRRAVLMVVAALVLAGNAAIWMMPIPQH